MSTKHESAGGHQPELETRAESITERWRRIFSSEDTVAFFNQIIDPTGTLDQSVALFRSTNAAVERTARDRRSFSDDIGMAIAYLKRQILDRLVSQLQGPLIWYFSNNEYSKLLCTPIFRILKLDTALKKDIRAGLEPREHEVADASVTDNNCLTLRTHTEVTALSKFILNQAYQGSPSLDDTQVARFTTMFNWLVEIWQEIEKLTQAVELSNQAKPNYRPT